MKIIKPILFLFVILMGCQSKPAEETNKISDADLQIRANELAHKFIITDGHIDLPYRLKEDNFNIETDKEILIKTDKGDFDYERAKKGGLDAPFMSIYIPASYQETGGAKELADSLINMVKSITEAHPDKFAIATSPGQVKEQFASGKISLPLGMENGAPIGDELSNVAYFHERGIRYITLTHSKDNLICDSSYDTTRTWNGLSAFGREVVSEMNKVGIMIDVSHISDSTFYQVMELSKAPVIASHSSCRHFTSGFERNMSDDMIKLLGEKNGVIQINFGSTFLDQRSRDVRQHITDYLQDNNLNYEDSAAQAYIASYSKENPIYSNVQKVADHIDRVVEIAGIDHVGLGSDFDGVGDTLPEGLKDVSHYPNLIYELLKRGYSEEDIEKICYKNVFRVWEETAKVAASK
ncbi:dipeptidase [Fulvivirga kasyanovii]|uniref:Membrane dipeptidase n=1 Tax=Fulvivirga kasyanovii TaxID=396812 RepID=A0ABW9RW36_9BACT|nr:dipeptidase [Fulvivirga kasyanovii]MTI28447.1 membrane dipeptidase [Fulvivirga kasyanovii]